MHPHFRTFVDGALARGFNVTVRTNLTIMLHEGCTDFPLWFSEHDVHLVASLPCYLPNNVDKQRGEHVYRDSIEVVQRRNAVGYGIAPDKVLDLIYNPLAPSLPPLRDAFSPTTLEGLMCRHQLHVGLEGTMYDCDFNFALGLPVEGERTHIEDLDADTFRHRRIATGNTASHVRQAVVHRAVERWYENRTTCVRLMESSRFMGESCGEYS